MAVARISSFLLFNLLYTIKSYHRLLPFLPYLVLDIVDAPSNFGIKKSNCFAA